MRMILIIVLRMMKRNTKTIVLLVTVITLSLALSSCSDSESASKKIVTSFYPLEFIAEQIAGDDFDTVNVTPVGVEPHDLELSPQTTQDVLEAKLAIVMGGGFQPAVEKTAGSRDGTTLEVLDAIDDSSDQVDPHIWLDPVLYKKAVNEVTDSVIAINPDEKQKYETREDELVEKLDALDGEYDEALSNCATTTFIASHDSFSRLAQRYGLVQESIAGISPDNEPSPQRLSELSELATSNEIDVIFTEELVSDKVAKTLSSEAGLTTKVLSPIEGLTQEQKDNDVDYFQLMRDNLVKLSSALRCSPA